MIEAGVLEGCGSESETSRLGALFDAHHARLYRLARRLAANRHDAPWAEQLTPAVVKALKDVQQFLPFKSYQVFDSTFIRGSRGSTSVKAPGNEIYLVNVNSWQMLNNEERFYVNLTVAPSEPVPLTKDGEKAPARAVLSTTLEMTVGETIVAGTSRQPRSGTALVMIVTALPPSALRQ